MKEKQESVKFTEKEAEYLVEQRLGRIATASPDLEPHVVPVGFEFDGSYIYFGGWSLGRTLKFRNIMRNNKVAFVVPHDVAKIKGPPQAPAPEVDVAAVKLEAHRHHVGLQIGGRSGYPAESLLHQVLRLLLSELHALLLLFHQLSSPILRTASIERGPPPSRNSVKASAR